VFVEILLIVIIRLICNICVHWWGNLLPNWWNKDSKSAIVTLWISHG